MNPDKAQMDIIIAKLLAIAIQRIELGLALVQSLCARLKSY